MEITNGVHVSIDSIGPVCSVRAMPGFEHACATNTVKSKRVLMPYWRDHVMILLGRTKRPSKPEELTLRKSKTTGRRVHLHRLVLARARNLFRYK